MATKSIFRKIIDREIPARIVYEDDLCLAFEDIHPHAPTHLIVIPKKEIPTVDDVSAEDEAIVGHLFAVMASIAAKKGLSGGYRGSRQLRPRRRTRGHAPALPHAGRAEIHLAAGLMKFN
jgi:histidine triad (HIT) family protein